jgi:tRNA uracil 4-sulfurtransferase
MRSVIVHYKEIALKGRNRPWFVNRLVENVRAATAGLDVVAVRALMGRLELTLGPRVSYDEVRARVERVFGIANLALAGHAPLDVDQIAAAIIADLPPEDPGSFRVSARRGDKRFPMTSPEIEREVGGRIKSARGWHVDLSDPRMTINVEMLSDRAFYSFGKDPGPGGLPTGVSGRVACLLSGGIDSPVAAFRLMKRGCSVVLVHFHSYPLLSRASQEKVREIAELLTRYQLRTRLYLVAFGEVQREVVLSIAPPLRVVIYRRLMMRIAERLAHQAGAKALVTGEVIGQVASQTLQNMAVIAAATSLPILRPLVGMDKSEITAEAERLGTYPISIIPDQDCCQLFTPRHPATKSDIESVEAAESAFALEELVNKAVRETQVEEFRFPSPAAASGGATFPSRAGGVSTL